jgi:hypothetical protein
LAVCAIQVLAWGVNARRNAVGVSGAGNFIAQAQWSPPGTWRPWLVLALLGASSLLLLAVAAIVGQRAARPVRVPGLPTSRDSVAG